MISKVISTKTLLLSFFKCLSLKLPTLNVLSIIIVLGAKKKVSLWELNRCTIVLEIEENMMR